MKASLNDPSAALLTVVRSFSRVIHTDIKFVFDDRWSRIVDGDGVVLAIRAHGEPAGALGDLQELPLGDVGRPSEAPT